MPAKRRNQQLARALGATARAARKQAGLTQVDVAGQIVMSSQVYARIERGEMLPSVTTLQELTVALGISADRLLELDHEDRQGVRQRRVQADSREVQQLIHRMRTLDPTGRQLLRLFLAALTRILAHANRPRRTPPRED